MSGRHVAAALFVLLLAGPVQAKVYKWVDESGQTVYSQTPPPTQEVEEVRVRGQSDGGSIDIKGDWYLRQGRELLQFWIRPTQTRFTVGAFTRRPRGRPTYALPPTRTLCEGRSQFSNRYMEITFVQREDPVNCPWPEVSQRIYFQPGPAHRLTIAPDGGTPQIWRRAVERAINPLETEFAHHWTIESGGMGDRLILDRGKFAFQQGERQRLAIGVWRTDSGRELEFEYAAVFEGGERSLTGTTQIWRVLRSDERNLVLKSGADELRLSRERR